MGATKSLCLWIMACAAWLHAFPAAAEEEGHAEGHHSRPAASSGTPATPPQTPESSGGSDYSQDSHHTSFPHQSTFRSLPDDLEVNGYATYTGVGAGKGAAFYPASSYSKFAWQFFIGARTQYVGAELGYTHLSTIPVMLNAQPADLITDALSFSLLGYLPLTANSDVFLRFGGVSWMVSANSNAAGYVPVTNGFNRVWGGGLEFRRGQLLLAVEKDIFRRVNQSDFYSFTGLRIGVYFN